MTSNNLVDEPNEISKKKSKILCKRSRHLRRKRSYQTLSGASVRTKPNRVQKATTGERNALVEFKYHRSNAELTLPRPVLLWYSNNDLRLHDHYALTFAAVEATKKGTAVVACFCFDLRALAQPSLVGGFFRCGPKRAQFLREAVGNLQERLAAHGIPFIIRMGHPEDEVAAVFDAIGAQKVYTTLQNTPHEELIQVRLASNLKMVMDRRKELDSTSQEHLVRVWSLTTVHIDDLITAPARMDGVLAKYWEDFQRCVIRPTEPYDCDDGRMRRINGRVLLQMWQWNREHNDVFISDDIIKRSRVYKIIKQRLFDRDCIYNPLFGTKFMTDATGIGNSNEPFPWRSNEAEWDQNVIDFPSYEEMDAGAYHAAKQGAMSPQLVADIRDVHDYSVAKNNICAVNTLLYGLCSLRKKQSDTEGESEQGDIIGELIEWMSGGCVVPSLSDLGYSPKAEEMEPVCDLNRAENFAGHTGGESHALNRLEQWLSTSDGIESFVPAGRKEADHMGGVMRGRHASRLSPWISHGCLSTRHVYTRIRQFTFGYMGENIYEPGCREGMMRIARRDFWHFMGMQWGRRLFFPYGPRPADTQHVAEYRRDSRIIQRWCAGLTGIPFADASMKELVGTGFANNHSRGALMWLLTRGLGQDWRVGAEWLERCSLDYDPWVNWGCSAYFSELVRDRWGDSIKPIAATANAMDAEGVYVKQWLPELTNVPSVYIHRIHVLTPRMQQMHGVRIGESYPYPIKLWDNAATDPKLLRNLPSYFPTDRQDLWPTKIGVHEATRLSLDSSLQENVKISVESREAISDNSVMVPAVAYSHPYLTQEPVEPVMKL